MVSQADLTVFFHHTPAIRVTACIFGLYPATSETAPSRILRTLRTLRIWPTQFLDNPRPDWVMSANAYTDEDWARLRRHITRLYYDEAKPLAEVIETMQRRYYFHATSVATLPVVSV